MEETLVVAGSEDRHVYIARLLDLLEQREQATIHTTRLGGWIRAIAFCRPVTGSVDIAAGCGDKYLYFLDTDGRVTGQILVDAKIHAIASDHASSIIYCSSDANRVDVVGQRPNGDRVIINSIQLPHRAIQLEFLDQQHKLLVAVCDDQRNYVIDTTTHIVIGAVALGSRVHAVRRASYLNTHMMIFGHGQRQLSSVVINPEKLAAVTDATTPAVLVPLDKDLSWRALGTAFVFGPKTQRLQVGIGRFIHIVPPTVSAPSLCIIGTDDGSVVLVELGKNIADATPFRIPPSDVYRVWSVYAYWDKDETLRLFAGTSEPNVRLYQLRRDESGWIIAAESVGIKVLDWPREIRPAVGASSDSFLIVCENGDVTITGRHPLSFNGLQVFRTGIAAWEADGWTVVTGSDNNVVSLYRGGEQQWQVRTNDRVREVITAGDYVFAVSEDRYLYVIDRQGQIVMRYRFPHRALAVDIDATAVEGRRIVVGCGDGYAYIIDEHNVIRQAYRLPDRIRDVKFLGQQLLIASEDRHLYIAPVWEAFLEQQQGADHIKLVYEKVRELGAAVAQEGIQAIEHVDAHEAFLLLAYLQHWLLPQNAVIAISLIDAYMPTIERLGNIKLHYIIAEALVHFALRNDPALAKARLEEYLQRYGDDVYAGHALISTVTAIARSSEELPDRERIDMLLDLAFSEVPLDDEWVREEACRALDALHLLELSTFAKLFTTVPIAYRKLEGLLSAARSRATGPLASVLRLIALATEPLAIEEGAQEHVTALLAGLPAVGWTQMFSNPPTEASSDREALLELAADLKPALERPVVADIIIKTLSEHTSTDAMNGAHWKILRALIEAQLFAGDPQLTGADYLTVQACLWQLRTLETRAAHRTSSEAIARSEDTILSRETEQASENSESPR
ncbi:MAG TPA: WD40 repeat domain-containing protein [Burkholderiales bacterium]|nr:WD40 repeat domain-containing protein [Burkholderiales bacterium]